jgi:hypothetical protein
MIGRMLPKISTADIDIVPLKRFAASCKTAAQRFDADASMCFL